MYTKRYTTREHLLDVYDKHARQMKLEATSIQEFNKWKVSVQETLREISGINMMESCDLSPEFLSEEVYDDHIKRKMLIQTTPKVWMPFYILIPKDMEEGEKRPVVLAPHGHGCGGKEGIAGNCNIPIIQKGIEKYDSEYGLTMVREGYIVFCPDARGTGERAEDVSIKNNEEDYMACSCNDLSFAAISLGQSLIGMMTWDLMRLVDYIETLDFCDASKIACVGLSGGGLQTLWLSALDERITASFVSGYFYTIKSALLHTHKCGCNFTPGLWKYVDIGDIAALIAPRPLIIETGDKDGLSGTMGTDGVIQQVDITRQAYALFNQEDQIEHHIFDGGHVFHGEKLINFLEEWKA